MSLWVEELTSTEPLFRKLDEEEAVSLHRKTLIGLPGIVPADKAYGEGTPLPEALKQLLSAMASKMGEDGFPEALFHAKDSKKMFSRFSNIIKQLLVGAETDRFGALDIPIYFYAVEDPAQSSDDVFSNNKNNAFAGKDAHVLARRIFAPNLTKGGKFTIVNGVLKGEPLEIAEIKERLGNLRLMANSLGTSLVVQLEVVLQNYLQDLGFSEQQKEEIACCVAVVGTANLATSINNAAMHGKKEELHRAGFRKIFFEFCQDKVASYWTGTENPPLRADKYQLITSNLYHGMLAVQKRSDRKIINYKVKNFNMLSDEAVTFSDAGTHRLEHVYENLEDSDSSSLHWHKVSQALRYILANNGAIDLAGPERDKSLYRACEQIKR